MTKVKTFMEYIGEAVKIDRKGVGRVCVDEGLLSALEKCLNAHAQELSEMREEIEALKSKQSK